MKVLQLKSISCYSRNYAKVLKFVEQMSAEFGITVSPCRTPREACASADLIVTTTSSTDPILELSDLKSSNVTIIAIGSDGTGKREIAASVFDEIINNGGKVVADSRAQVLKIGECQYYPSLAVDGGRTTIVEFGDIITGKAKGREGKELICVDLTGCGVQDVEIALAVFKEWKKGEGKR